MLEYTNHPLVDIGIATMTAFANREDPSHITQSDLDAISDLIEPIYSDGFSKNFYASIVFPNSGFGQPAFDGPKFRYKRQAYATLVLRGYRNQPLDDVLNKLDNRYNPFMIRGIEGRSERCVFTGRPAYMRATREMFPLLNGRTVINFGPNGTLGIPVSDIALLAIHAMPLGCVPSQGRLLAVVSDDRALMQEFARKNLEDNLRYLHLTSLDSMPNFSAFRTKLLERLIVIVDEGMDSSREHFPSLTAYHFSNAGQDAKIDIYELPSQVIQFVSRARKLFPDAWNRITQTAWHQQKPEDEEMQSAKPKISRRNLFYEDLFDLPDQARRFLGTYLLRRPLNNFKADPRADYDTMRDIDIISWDLTALFLKGIMNMEKNRIDNIRQLGDRLAEYIRLHNDRRLLREMYFARANEYWKFRKALIQAAQRPQGNNREPLVAFDIYVGVFEEGIDAERPDWQLARDLLMIRVIEQLHREQWLAANVDSLEPETEEASA